MLFAASPVAADKPVAVRKTKASETVLPPRASETSLETIENEITAVGRFGDKLLLLSRSKPFFIVTPFRQAGKNRGEIFGALFESRRVNISKVESGAQWQGIVGAGSAALMFDGVNLNLLEIGTDDLKERAMRSLAWDGLIKSPRDRLGEATRFETQKIQSNFKKRFNEQIGAKIFGVAPLPPSWRTGIVDKAREKDFYFLVATRLKGFPLITLQCSATEPSQCAVLRYCTVAGLTNEQNATLSGLATSPKRNLVLLGDPKNHRILKFHFRSCLDIRKSGSMRLPEKLKELTTVHVDDEETLWLATAAPDDYLNASVFFWKDGEW